MNDLANTRDTPDIDYLTRDYRGFRAQLIALLERSNTQWTERSAADLGVVVLEALAYQLDHLAYTGDRIAAEGYLRTARRRQSVRQHAALGDHKLDRGSSSCGFQHFNVAVGAIELPAQTQVGPPLRLGQRPEHRDVFETFEAALLDARRNRFTLRKSIAAGSSLLWLGGEGQQALDLWTLGIRPGMRLALISRDHSEVVTVAQVQDSAVLLESPCPTTFIAGGSERATLVYGNLVAIRAGQRSDWRDLGRGGASRDDVSAGFYICRRIALLQGLFELLEDHRDTWNQHPDLSFAWSHAQRLARLAICLLRTSSTTAIPTGLVDRILDLLRESEVLLRDSLRALGLAVPPELRPSQHVTTPHQRITLPSDAPTLWHDYTTTLDIQTLQSGRTQAWTEVEDLLQSGPNDRHYIAEFSGEHDITLHFGDGRQGAMLPAGAPILGRWVFGDADLGDVGPRALTRALGPIATHLEATDPTHNPLETVNYRPPEPIEEVADRIRRELASPAIPVTRDDFITILEAHQDITEAVVLPTKEKRVKVALRLATHARGIDTLSTLQRWIDDRRLAGTRVHLALGRPLYINITALLMVHPEADSQATRSRCRDAIHRIFADSDRHRLGAPQTRGDLFEVIESTIGVIWSQLLRFARAGGQEPTVAEKIEPAPDQHIRCLDLDDNPATGTIEIWVAQEYSAQIELLYVDPDLLPPLHTMQLALQETLSGPTSALAAATKHALTIDVLQKVLSAPALRGTHHRLQLRALIRGDRNVDTIHMHDGDAPVLKNLQIIPKRVEALE